MRILLILFLSYSSLFAGKDSTRWDFRIKGFDLKIGASFVYNSLNQNKAILLASTPLENQSFYIYDSVYLSSGSPSHRPVRLRLACIIGNNSKTSRWLFHKGEFCFGLAFDIQNRESIGHKSYSRIKFSLNPNYTTSAIINYTYQCQSVELGYQFSSKSFLKHFALFGGVSSAFGFNTYKQIDMADYYKFNEGEQEEDIHTGYFSAYANLGIKYNFTCELNFFTQAEAGINAYGKTIGGTALFNAYSFGMRYKIIDEQDRKHYMNSSFW